MKPARILAALLLCILASLSFGAGKKVLGKLGQTTAKTNIYAAMTTKARVFYHAQAYEYLVVQKASSTSWVKVLLQNGSYGYVVAEKVAELPYEVSVQQAARGQVRGTPSLAPSSRSGTALAGYALNFVGTPYVWGGNDERKGIDCSGFVKKMFGRIGVDLPRTAAEQVNVGQSITRLEDLQAGDRLYFWSAKRGKIGHTGIYLGNGYFIHSSTNHGGVATDYLGTKNWLKILVAARR